MPFRCIRCQRDISKEFMACPHCGEPVTDFLRRYLEEPIDGKYEILERLGAGGMGEVYKVRHTYLGALRVVKVIRPQISDNQDAHDRFLREARLATKVQHTNIATLHDFSALPDGSHYMVWEYIEGENLAQRLRARGPFAPRYAVGLALQALRGLDAIHRAGIVHRDISPENLMLTRDGHGDEQVKIIDLGVAKTEEPVENATRTGIFVGKLRYASPEQLGFLEEGGKIDGRADLYALAIVLYEMVAGRPPFEATSPHQYILMHSRDTQFRPLEIPPDLPGGEALQNALQRALARDRDKRFASAREFAAALAEIERALPDASAEQTLVVARPDDPTRITDRNTLTRTTARTQAPPPTTIRTPIPGDPTLRTPMPAVPPQPAKSPVLAIVLAIVVTAIVIGGGAAFVFSRRDRAAAPQQVAAQTATAAVQPGSAITATASPATTVTIEPVNTETTPTTAAPATTTQSAAEPVPPPREPQRKEQRPAPQPQPQPQETKEPEPAEPRQDEPAESQPGRTYIDGSDAGSNEVLLAELTRHLAGVSRVAIQGTGDPLMTAHLAKLVGEYATVTAEADVMIRFNGTLERLGRGRKRRAAEATITKNGRVIFRYQLPAEEYRVGDNPAEAFSRVLSEALER